MLAAGEIRGPDFGDVAERDFHRVRAKRDFFQAVSFARRRMMEETQLARVQRGRAALHAISLDVAALAKLGCCCHASNPYPLSPYPMDSKT